MYKTSYQTFYVVSQTGSFSKAAAQLYISPSAVTQQMNSLEAELNVRLFNRTARGVTLTPAGEYLAERTKTIIHDCDETLRELQQIGQEHPKICVGTSILEKCRLLYDLWVLYNQSLPDDQRCEINMVSIDSRHNIPESTDLIESINGGVDWMLDWDFFKIADVPFALATDAGNPLHEKKTLHLSDIAGQHVVSLNRGSSPTVSKMVTTLEMNGAHLIFADGNELPGIWDASFRHDLLLVPQCWEDILINMKVHPVKWNFTLPYGIFYRRNASPATKAFVDFIAKTYSADNTDGIVPFF